MSVIINFLFFLGRPTFFLVFELFFVCLICFICFRIPLTALCLGSGEKDALFCWGVLEIGFGSLLGFRGFETLGTKILTIESCATST